MFTRYFFFSVIVSIASTITANNELLSHLNAWKSSDAGKFALANGFAGGLKSLNEELIRFKQSLANIAKLSLEHTEASFSINTPFALMSSSEFSAFVKKSQYSGNQMLFQGERQEYNVSSTVEFGGAAIPTSVDWVKEGCVNPVKDQGQCGSCWTFAAVGAIESGYCISNNKKNLPNLSEQQLVACDKIPNAGGCDGGLPSLAIDYVKSIGGGLCSEKDYPYASTQGTSPSCKSNTCKIVPLGVTGYVQLPDYDVDALKKAVAQQPVAVAVQADSQAFQYYSSGVLTGKSCPGAQLDHAVIAVGYGTQNGRDYWKIRNSWSSSWGLDGYLLIERGYKGAKGGACGVETNKLSVYPTFSKGPLPTPTAAPTSPPTPTPSSSSSNSGSASSSSSSFWW